ncbi:MAG: type II secretion system protein [Clostridiaceae bacterium]|nr:type II secretion system protein [Clostridiaceae bacterium]
MKTKYKFKNKLYNKLNNKRGETLIEVLVSLVIIVLVIMMLTSAIALAAKFNKRAEDKNISTMMDRAPGNTIADAEITVSYTFTGLTSVAIPVNAYESKDAEGEEFCFYDYYEE